MIQQILTTSPEETEAFGASIAEKISSDPSLPRFIALYGDLGVGKTAFVRGLAGVLSPRSAVRSPTFALVNEYRGGSLPIFHFDMYRIESEDELESIGFYDYLDRGLCVVEWSENIGYALPESYLKIEISKCDESAPDKRAITVRLIHD
ncbi:MAG: tRNA (adenosine(37)-N6)-threonylcarbamoyltransferase complex ATPase subunit type 1 TsaE [Clostridia bacterium]|nr:tRNA (adenosine(37)-N6)-threonylcarbamoyltransferase complex ATPase subunit type 1 TsaE [Clostridia bacterium]